MSDIRGPLSMIGVPIADAMREHHHQPPDKMSVAVVGWVAAALAGWVYLGPAFVGGLLGVSGGGVEARAVWAGVGLPLLCLLFGLYAAGGQRDLAAAFGWLLLAVGWAALLWFEVYPDPRGLVGFLVKGVYCVSLAENLARAMAAAQPFRGGSALRRMERQLRRQNAPMRPVRRH